MEKQAYHNIMREHIIASARDLFARYSFKKTTMGEIAKAADKAKSSIYYYFKSKEEIFQAVAHAEIQKWQDALTDAVNREASPQGKLAAYIKTRMSAIRSLSSFYNFLAEEYFENYRLIEKLRVELDKEETGAIKDILREGINKKKFHVKHLEITASNILNILKGLEHVWMKEKDAAKLEEKIETLLALFLKGLLAR